MLDLATGDRPPATGQRDSSVISKKAESGDWRSAPCHRPRDPVSLGVAIVKPWPEQAVATNGKNGSTAAEATGRLLLRALITDPLGSGVHVERAFAHEADDGHPELLGEVDGKGRGR